MAARLFPGGGLTTTSKSLADGEDLPFDEEVGDPGVGRAQGCESGSSLA
jgi:hypothetical protein